MPDARCTRYLVCNVHKTVRTRAYWAAENIRDALRYGFTAYAVISPETSSWLTPSLSFPLALLRQLDAGNGRQDHTVLPYARSTPSSDVNQASTATRPTSVTTADALLSRTGWPNVYT